MTDNREQPMFPGNMYWAGPAKVQAMPVDAPSGPRAGEMANILAFRERSGKTTVDVTWKIEGQPNLACHKFQYETPRAALDAGWELGEKFERDAAYLEQMRRIYG